jgi:hypothetical protein
MAETTVEKDGRRHSRSASPRFRPVRSRSQAPHRWRPRRLRTYRRLRVRDDLVDDRPRQGIALDNAGRLTHTSMPLCALPDSAAPWFCSAIMCSPIPALCGRASATPGRCSLFLNPRGRSGVGRRFRTRPRRARFDRGRTGPSRALPDGAIRRSGGERRGAARIGTGGTLGTLACSAIDHAW